jgi:hypothetical protein
MFVEARVIGRSRPPEVRETTIQAADVGCLRDLVELLVAEELAGYETRRQDAMLLQVLAPEDLVRGHETGRYGAGPAGGPAPRQEDAVRRAFEAFTDGLYFVVADDRQIEALDEPLSLGDDSRLRFVRLVALAGG